MHFRKQVRSMRGELVDFSALATQNANQVALGNARMNAKGDLLDVNGVVLKTQEQLNAEWELKKAKSQEISADIKTENPVPLQQKTQTLQPLTTEYPSIQDLVDSGVIPTKKKPTQND